MVTTCLTTRGYSVVKSDLRLQQIEEIKDELTVTPFSAMDFALNKPIPFKMYQESNTKLYLPKAYGLKKFGIPLHVKIGEGVDINVIFKGHLRSEQLEPVGKYLEAAKDKLKMGGIITVPCGGGKCLGKDTPVMMFDGTVKNVQDVEVGDALMGDDSTPRFVSSTCEGIENLYKIKNVTDGSFYVVNESHVLSLKCPMGARYDIDLTEYMKMPNYLLGYRVPVEFPHTDVERDPYEVGRDELQNIPEDYIYNSRAVRSRLLSGILDTHSSFIRNENKTYLKDVIFVARSLGYFVEVDGDSAVRITRQKLTNNIEIEFIGKGSYYGFELNGNGRFLLGDFTVTHNTTMAIYIMCQLQKKSLIVVHKDFLLQQWKERIQQFAPNASIGLLKAQTVDIAGKDIVIASLQSLSMKDYDIELFKDFGMVCFDEVHHLGAEVFSEALKKVNFKYSLGLSATPRRKDGLAKVFIRHIGDIVYNVASKKETLSVKLVPFFDSHASYSQEIVMFKNKLNVSRMVNNICSFLPRMTFITDIIKDLLAQEARKILILSDRRTHIDVLLQMLSEENIECGPYYGGLKDGQLKTSEKKVVIGGTFQFAAEGLDIPGLNTLILASPKTDVVQVIGRIQRDKPEDRVFQPLVIDIIDDFSIFNKQAKKRMAYYKKCKYNIIDEHDVFTDKTKVVLPASECLIVSD